MLPSSGSSIMNSSIFVSAFSDAKNRLYLYRIFIGASLICFTYFIGSALIAKDYRERISKWPMEMMGTMHKPNSKFCRNQCRPLGSEALPEGIVVQTSNLEMRPLWDSSSIKEKMTPSLNLLAIAVGVKQKDIVNKMVEKFLSNGFLIMLFHYDGFVDEWSDLKWNDLVIHVSAKNQTKWWFAKRFLHPDIVAEYDYVFLWDEDLDVENFNPQRYIRIIKSEGLEISQPALDPFKSVVHHPITARNNKATVHRRFYKTKGSGRCDENSTSPPCLGWVEMMAPAFSKAAWQCVWYMIQGDRTRNVGVVDSEYIVHLGLPTLGVMDQNKESSEPLRVDNRPAVRRQSFIEMQIFVRRWNNAVKNAKCWVDLYKQTDQQSNL
ncbi:Jhy protein [Bienertia sinuspersici]